MHDESIHKLLIYCMIKKRIITDERQFNIAWLYVFEEGK